MKHEEEENVMCKTYTHSKKVSQELYLSNRPLAFLFRPRRRQNVSDRLANLHHVEAGSAVLTRN